MALRQQAYVDDLLAECYAYFEQGLLCDEADEKKEACHMYERGLDIMKLAEREKECGSNQNYKNMIETRVKVQGRLEVLKKAVATAINKESVLKEDLTNELREQLQTASFPEAELIFLIPNGDNDTTVPTIPSALEIFKLPKQHGSAGSPQADAFMKVGPWVYPLKSGNIPVLRNEFGAYVMPNPTPDHPNLFVGILLPANLGDEVGKRFCEVLNQYAEVRDQEISKNLSKEERKKLSEKIAALLMKGSENIAWGVNYAAEKASEMVTERSVRLRSSITPKEQPVHVNSLIRTGVYCVHGGSKVVAKCTKYLLDRIGDMGVTVGKTLASGAEKTFGEGKSGNLVSGTLTVLVGGIASVGTVWIALENASKTLCKNIANETVETVRQKYGDEASVTAHKALYATGHTTLAAMQLYDLGPRAIAGRTARKVGVNFLKTLHEARSSSSLKVEENEDSFREPNGEKEDSELKKKKKRF